MTLKICSQVISYEIPWIQRVTCGVGFATSNDRMQLDYFGYLGCSATRPSMTESEWNVAVYIMRTHTNLNF